MFLCCPLLCFVMVRGWPELAEAPCFSSGSDWTPFPPTQGRELPHGDHSPRRNMSLLWEGLELPENLGFKSACV